MTLLKRIAAIFWKDILAELRTKEMIFSMLVFSLMVTVIFNFSFPPGSEFIQGALPGMLWMTFIFASLLGMNRSFVYEVDKGCLQGLMLAPMSRVAIYVSKFLVNVIFIGMVELIMLPFFSIFFDMAILNHVGELVLVILLSTLGLSTIGTLFSAISVNTRTREVMLPILHFPVSIPIIIGAVQATAAVLQEEDWSVTWGWLKIIIAFDIIFFIVSLLTFEYIIEE
ncbi:ABC transporter permease [candidate division KSB1 bacterium]|nr:ABC transporter permease [candidate division KSB1 bacterium]NIR73329.1 ABC transporter permease [candidate division KSB1 bacterium]NIS27035.1 ABC transporter permease [candidate division KSB1 bacterium]NIT73875.1 ABC transporter permease [candidate division KSB1 bacterium]NIU27780.1 ABC transporter permease [candidate division KSB1 bacterium]